jgi:hypothetical protein
MTSVAETNLVIHFSAILSRIPLAEANLVIHSPTLLLWTLYFIYIEHNIIVIAFIKKTLNCISVNERGNHAPAPSVSWPSLIENPIMVATPESQRNLWSWFLQAKYYWQSIIIHYTYNSFYACSFHHHNIHISSIFSFVFIDLGISTTTPLCDNLGIYIWIWFFMLAWRTLKSTSTLSNMITHKELQVQFIYNVLHSFVVKGCLEQQ